MMILPAIDVLSGKCVRLFQGNYDKKTVYEASPADVAINWEALGAEYIHLVDLDGAREGKLVNIDTIRLISDAISVPCELGGGIRTVNDAKLAFEAGVSRIILGTTAAQNKSTVKQLLEEYGAEKIVVGIDAKDGKVAIKGWLEDSGIDAIELAQEFYELGVKRFIYTDILRDGSLAGPNFNAIIEFCNAIPLCNIIASGGVGKIDHVKKLKAISTQCPNLEGVIIGKALYDGKISLQDIL